MTDLKCYAGVLISFLVIDAIWIIGVAKPLYNRTISELMRTRPRVVPAAIFYLAYPAGIVMLACRPALASGDFAAALFNGAILGGIAYGTFTLTNHALLKGWTSAIVVSDILWGAALTGASAWIGVQVAGL